MKRVPVTNLLFALGLTGIALAAISQPAGNDPAIVGWTTNGPAVYAMTREPVPGDTNGNFSTNQVFHHFLPESLNNLIWTNFIAHTNGRDMVVWATRSHSPNWPATPPVASYNQNSLLWGMKGLTALSPCWTVEGAPGQVPVTALTRRHAYARGHGMGVDGFNTNFVGQKIWFVTTNNQVVEAKVVRDVVRTFPETHNRDYTILFLSKDLPDTIQPIGAAVLTNVLAKYPTPPGAPHPVFKTEQTGRVSAEVPGLTYNTWKGGDSGSPDMLPMPDQLVFYAGRSTSGPSADMQADMDHLCELEHLAPQKYQLQWVDLSQFPSYQ